jgi:arylsulfatase
MGQAMAKKMKTYADYPPRPKQSDTYAGPITLSGYFRFEEIREQLKKEGITIPMHTGN